MFRNYEVVKISDLKHEDFEQIGFIGVISVVAREMKVDIKLWLSFTEYQSLKIIICDTMKKDIPIYEKYEGKRLFVFKPKTYREYRSIFSFIYLFNTQLDI